MFLMIDNYDSFVYNLVMYLKEIDQDIVVVKNDAITIEEIMNMTNLEGIIISPGPKSPSECGISKDIVRKMAGQVPILGVCLGHQIIGYVYGAEIEKGQKPMHGKVTSLMHNGKNLFQGLKASFLVTRYHSLVVNKSTLPEILRVDATSEDGEIMAISHLVDPVYGVQFHPEALMTEYGHELLMNFVQIGKAWRIQFENDNGRCGIL